MIAVGIHHGEMYCKGLTVVCLMTGRPSCRPLSAGQRSRDLVRSTPPLRPSLPT